MSLLRYPMTRSKLLVIHAGDDDSTVDNGVTVLDALKVTSTERFFFFLKDSLE
jgi:hypothetical protein